MNKWRAYHQGSKFFSGCEVDFVEQPQIQGVPRSNISEGDVVEIDWPDGRGDEGIITNVDATGIVIKVNENEYKLRPAGNDDIINPIKGNGMRVDPWIVI